MDENPSWTEERFRRLLQGAQPYARGRAVLGAALGAVLRRLEPSFHASVLGDANLKSLLARFPDVGAIHPDDKSPDFWFRFSGGGGDESLPPLSARPGQAWIDRDLWLGLVAEHPREARYFDLQTNRIVVIPLGDAGEEAPLSAPLSAEPERYLRAPSISQEELRSLAREFVEKIEDGELRKRLEEAIAGEGWFSRFTATLSETVGRSGWLVAHRTYVVEWATRWLQEHGFAPGLFIKRGQSATLRAPRMREPSAGLGLTRRDIRKIVLEAISKMPDEELIKLSIPLRFLLPDS